jgi:hypothetical protein
MDKKNPCLFVLFEIITMIVGIVMLAKWIF